MQPRKRHASGSRSNSVQATQSTRSFANLTTVAVNRRMLLRRAGLVGMALPFAGALFGACGSADTKPTTAAAQLTSATSPVAVASAPVELTITAKDLSFTPTAL